MFAWQAVGDMLVVGTVQVVVVVVLGTVGTVVAQGVVGIAAVKEVVDIKSELGLYPPQKELQR